MSKKLIGRNFGPYWIKDKLGHGGMATVFEAAHKETGQNVAIKILHEQFNDNKNIRKRFEHEAKIAAQLEHPNIVPIWDYGEFNNRVYLTMPLMKGGSFATVLAKAGELQYSTSLEILGLLADALDYAHSRGVVHRDFKLENILLNDKNVPAISDFGIAKSAESSRITMTGQLLGSPQYIAPENFSNVSVPDYRQDLYAFAVTAYLMITGYFPFTGQGALNVIEKHRNTLAPNPSEINPQLPLMLDDVFAKALAKDPHRRFSSAREFVYGLEAAFLNMRDGVAKVFLNAENPVPPLSTTLIGAALNPNLTAAINLNAISKSETIVSSGFVPAYENPNKKKGNRFVMAFIFFCIVLVGAVIALAAERSFARTDVVTTLDAYERILVTETSTEAPSPTGTISPSPTPSPTGAVSPSPTATLRATNARESVASPTLSITATTFSFYFGTPATKASAVSTTVAPITGGGSVGGGNGNGGGSGQTNTQVPVASRTPLPTNVPPTNVPATQVPPTNVPATQAPPTSVPPTNPPPPTNVPPTQPPIVPTVSVPTLPPLLPTDEPDEGSGGNSNGNSNGNGNGNGRGNGGGSG